jgi:hypothetical protein
MGINDRFNTSSSGMQFKNPVQPMVVYQSATSVTTGDAETKTIASLTIPSGSMAPGTTFRVTMCGTKTGANGTLTVGLYLGGSSVLSIDADADTAVDWMAILHVVQVSPKVQRCFGQLLTLTEDPRVDYATAAIDCSSSVVLSPVMANEHASDEITCDVCIIEYWQKSDD